MLRKLNPLQVKFSIHRKTHREIVCCLLLSHPLPGTYFQIIRLFICSLYHTSRFPRTELAPISVSGWEVPYFLRKNCPQMPLKQQPIEPSPMSAKRPAYRTVPNVKKGGAARHHPNTPYFPFTESRCQMSSTYCLIVRSEENLPAHAVFIIAILAQPFLSR